MHIDSQSDNDSDQKDDYDNYGVGGFNISIGVWNVEGLAGGRNWKFDNPTLREHLLQFDIMLLCETWTDENCYLDLNGYERHTLNRTDCEEEKDTSQLWWFVYLF